MLIDFDMLDRVNAERREEKLKKEQEERKLRVLTDDEIKKNRPQYDSIYTLDNGPATVLYILAMAVGTIFTDRWIIYIVVTIIWWRHITRHNR